MTDKSITTPANPTSTLTLDEWIYEIEVAGGPCMPARQLEAMLKTAPPSIKKTAQFQYWQGVLDTHQVHLFFGGVAA